MDEQHWKTFWQGKRPAGVDDEVNPDMFESLHQVIDESLIGHAEYPAFTSLGYTLTFQKIDQYSQQFATYLQHHTDLRAGDRIAIQLPNLLQYPVVMYGALRAGLVIVNVNPLYTAREILHVLKDSKAKALVYLDKFGHLVEQIQHDTELKYFITTKLADLLPTPKRQLINFFAKYVKKMVPPYHVSHEVSLRSALKKGQRNAYQPPANSTLTDPAVLQYTGGTTGVAKAAVLTHRNLIANMLQAKSMLSQRDDHGQRIISERSEILIAPLPLYHIYAFTVHLLCMPLMGNHSILIANPRDTETFIKFIKPWRFTIFIGLNTLFSSLMAHPRFKECDFSALKVTLSGGTALQAPIAKRWQQLTQSIIAEAYGLSECSPAVCMNPVGRLTQAGTVGLPVPSTELKTIDKQGNVTELGEAGELCVRGPQVMPYYWHNESETALVLSEDGWLKTGDIAIIQHDGFVRIIDRLKDMILVSGFNVYPNEIEDVMSGHPHIAICAAIGIPDDKTGEAVKLFVVLDTPTDSSVTETELTEWARQHLTSYKVPKQYEFRNSLPMTPVGKILRKDLR